MHMPNGKRVPHHFNTTTLQHITCTLHPTCDGILVARPSIHGTRDAIFAGTAPAGVTMAEAVQGGPGRFYTQVASGIQWSALIAWKSPP